MRDKIFIDLQTRLRRFKEEWAIECMERIKEKTPEKSGRLKESYFVQQKKDGFDLGSVEDYFTYVEHGTSKMRPRRMVGRTLLEEEEITAIAIERAKK